MTDERWDSRTERFLLANLDVLELSARYSQSSELHTGWSIGYAPEREENGGRVVFGQLHSVGSLARGHAMVSAQIFDVPGSSTSDDEMEQVLTNSIAAETLYDYARTTLSTALGAIEVDVNLPRESPVPEITQLVRRDSDGKDAAE